MGYTYAVTNDHYCCCCHRNLLLDHSNPPCWVRITTFFCSSFLVVFANVVQRVAALFIDSKRAVHGGHMLSYPVIEHQYGICKDAHTHTENSMKPIEAEMHPITFVAHVTKRAQPGLWYLSTSKEEQPLQEGYGGISCHTAVGVIHVVFWDMFHDNSDLHLCGAFGQWAATLL